MDLRKIRTNSKGNLYAWLIVLMSIALIGLIYVSMYPLVKVELPAMANAVGVNESEDGTNTINIIVSSYDNYPIVAIIGLFMAALIYSQRDQWGTRGA